MIGKASGPLLKKRTKKLFYCSLELFLVLGLASCSSADPTYYTLLPQPGAVLPGAPLSIEIRRPGLAGYLDRSDIVLKSAAYTLDVNSALRWGEPLGDMIGRVLSQDIAQRLPRSSVFTQSGAITADPDLRIEIDIQRFDADASGSVVLTAEVAMEAGRSHVPTSTRHVALTAPPPAPGAAGLVAAMSGLLGQLSDQLAADARQAPPLAPS